VRPHLRAVPSQGSRDPGSRPYARKPPADPPREVVGVDPGERETGVVTRDGHSAVAVAVVTGAKVERSGPKSLVVDHGYIAAVLAEIGEQISGSISRHGTMPLLAVESLTAPLGGKLAHVTIRPLLGASAVLGAVLGRFVHAFPHISAVLVPPGGHGSLPLGAYPENLRGDREGSGSLLAVGTGRLRHARSAFDIAASANHPALSGPTWRYPPPPPGR
jgi:hypothetical protein